MGEIRYDAAERPSPREWLEFLRRSDLGRLYPRRDFEERFRRMVRGVDVVVTARDGDALVGLCAGLTDFAYFLFVTDLGVARGYERRGIGRGLVRRALEAAGSDVCAVTWSNREALGFYARLGFASVPTLVGREGPEGPPLDPDAVACEDAGPGTP
jgi:ribosomal protein S18 acetylase RimI-like enzyme